MTTLNKYTASVLRKILDAVPVDYYTERIPKQVKTPSLYFHIVGQDTESYTKFKYKILYTQEISVFEKDSTEAEALSDRVIQALMKNNAQVTLVNQDGSFSSEVIKLEGASSLEQQEGIYRVTATWKVEYDY